MKIKLEITVTAPNTFKRNYVQALINDLLDVGYADAEETARQCEEGESKEAEDVLKLKIGEVKLCKQ